MMPQLRNASALARSPLKRADPSACPLSRRMQSRVERERLLRLHAIETCGLERVEDQVPAMSGHGARNRHEAMATKKIVAESLLACAQSPRSQPIGVWHVVALDDVNLGNIG